MYRYLPGSNPMETGSLANGGRLQMLRVVGVTNAHLEAMQAQGATSAVDWVDIDEPAPTFSFTPGVPAPTTNNDALNHVGNQGRAQGAAHFSRLEGATFTKNKIFFSSTQGGGAAETGPDTVTGYGNGSGQIWSYDTKAVLVSHQAPVDN